MSSKTRQNYPLEFKVSSVKLAIDSDQSTAQTARDLGINPNSIYSWIAEYSNSNKNNQKNMSGNANSFEENKRLKKELAMVKQERDLLKKAGAHEAKESR
ncbi:MAG: transposase [Rickettsiales bacterium]|jgi:transposase